MNRLDALRVLAARVEREIAAEERARAPYARPGRHGVRRRRQPAQHGSEGGYARHRAKDIPFPEDAGGEPCGCREAHAAAEKRRNEARRKRLA